MNIKTFAAIAVISISSVSIAQTPSASSETPQQTIKADKKEAANARKAAAADYQTRLLQDGGLGDVTVTASGPDSTHLTIYTQNVSAVLFAQLDPQIRTSFARAIALGFTQLTIESPATTSWKTPDGGCNVAASCTHTWYF